MPTVSPIFPPLIWSAFDSGYPSAAAVSAFLRPHQIATTQDDLNYEFACFLVNDLLFGRLGAGNVAHLNSVSLSITRNRSRGGVKWSRS
jgi:hypothetical protein